MLSSAHKLCGKVAMHSVNGTYIKINSHFVPLEYGRRILDMNSLYYSQKMYTIRRVVAMVMVPSLQEYNYATNEVSNWWHNYECVTGPSGSS